MAQGMQSHALLPSTAAAGCFTSPLAAPQVGADLSALVATLRKPLRCVWISQASVSSPAQRVMAQLPAIQQHLPAIQRQPSVEEPHQIAQQNGCLPVSPVQDTGTWQCREGELSALPFTPVVLIGASATTARHTRCLQLPPGKLAQLCLRAAAGCWPALVQSQHGHVQAMLQLAPPHPDLVPTFSCQPHPRAPRRGAAERQLPILPWGSR